MRQKDIETTEIASQAAPELHWRIRAVGLLLFGQAAALVFAALYNGSLVNWAAETENFTTNMTLMDALGLLSSRAIDAISLAGLFLATAVLCFLAGLGFLILWRGGRILAIAAQGIVLGVCLYFYFRQSTSVIYPIMVYSVILVLYLNSFTVQAAFHNRSQPPLIPGEHHS
jgi:hypothetical protein